MRHLESQEQQAIFKWVKYNLSKYPELALLHSSQNGVRFTSPMAAKRAKDEGLLPGLPDIHLPVPKGGYASLYIELKAPKGRLQENQKEVLALLSNYGNYSVVCYGAQAAIECIKNYMSGAYINEKTC